MDAFLAPETVTGFKHDKHGEIDIVKETRFTYLPLALLIVLKRFQKDAAKKGRSKTDRYIDYNMELELHSARYKLVALCLHMGTMEDGHYTAMVVHRNRWQYIDDDVCNDVTDLNTIIRKEAYMLVYKRVD
jgi:ubiquitin C-terminal hydrolase